MSLDQTAFVICKNDTVATALSALRSGFVRLTGEPPMDSIEAIQDIPNGHKIALYDIQNGENIVKYGVVIGCAVQDIPAGSWVHLHCMRSLLDERSSHLDVMTGVPSDISYE